MEQSFQWSTSMKIFNLVNCYGFKIHFNNGGSDSPWTFLFIFKLSTCYRGVGFLETQEHAAQYLLSPPFNYGVFVKQFGVKMQKA